MRLLPGDPLLIFMAQSAELDAMPREALEELRREYGLDKPILVQYFHWVWGILRGDFGTSIFYREKVGTLMLERFPITLHLGLLALICSLSIGLSVGLIAAVRRGKWPDKVFTPLTYLGVTVPVFWLGILLIYFFGLKLRWLPIAGYTSPLDDFWLSTRQAIMPVICLSIYGLASNARQMRSSMLEVIHQDYIRTAEAKGLHEKVVIYKHAFRNAAIPLVTIVAIDLPVLFAGALFTETIYSWPGMGRLFVNSSFRFDYPIVMGIVITLAFLVVISNLLADIVYAILDPRITYT